MKTMKQKQITDEVQLEQNLKSELESKKMQLEQLQKQVVSVKRLITQDEARKANLVEDRKTDQVIGTGLNEIRGIVQDISAGIPIGHVAEDSSEEQLNELKRCLHLLFLNCDPVINMWIYLLAFHLRSLEFPQLSPSLKRSYRSLMNAS